MVDAKNVGPLLGTPRLQGRKAPSDTKVYIPKDSPALLVRHMKDMASYKIANLNGKNTPKEKYNDITKLNNNLKTIQEKLHNKKISLEKAINSITKKFNDFHKKYYIEKDKETFFFTDAEINDIQEKDVPDALDSLTKSLTDTLEEIKPEELAKPNFVSRIFIKIKDLFIAFFKKLGLIKTEGVTKPDSFSKKETDDMQLTNTIEGLRAPPNKDNFPSNSSSTEIPEADRKTNTNASNLKTQEINKSLTNDPQVQQDLIDAISNNEKDAVESLIKQIDNINIDIGDGGDFLMFAIEKGHTEIAELLINKTSININAITDQGISTLMVAIDYGNVNIVTMLVNKSGINIKATDMNGSSALMWATHNGNVEIVKLLIDVSDATAQDINGDTALMIAISGDHNKIAQLLINKTKIDINATNKQGTSALLIATLQGNTEIVKLLLNKKANVNSHDNYGNTALMIAVQTWNIDIVKQLLNKKANAQAKNNKGYTALELATEYGCAEAVKMLIKKSDASTQNHSYVKALYLAMTNEHEDVVKVFFNKSYNNNYKKDINDLVVFAADKSNTKIIERLIEINKISIDAYYNALFVAEENGFDYIVNVLINKLNTDNLKTQSKTNILINAIESGKTDIVKILLKRSNYDLNFTNENDYTALMLAAEKGQESIVKLLFEVEGIDINLQNKKGKTALDLAKKKGYLGIVKILENQENLE